MKIRILDGSCGRSLNAAIMAAAILKGNKLFQSHPWSYFYVAEWSQFLGVVWQAFALYSQSNTLSASNSKIPVVVEMDDGRVYRTVVWFDDVYHGLRYVSLYR